jgi:hypothetical protein
MNRQDAKFAKKDLRLPNRRFKTLHCRGNSEIFRGFEFFDFLGELGVLAVTLLCFL